MRNPEADCLELAADRVHIAGDGVPISGDATDQDFALACYNCLRVPDFSLAVEPSNLQMCAPDTITTTITQAVVAHTGSFMVAINPAGTRAYVSNQNSDDVSVIDTATDTFVPAEVISGFSLDGPNGKPVEIVPVDPFYRIRFHDGETFDYNGDPEHMRAEVARVAPGDEAGYQRFLDFTAEVYRVGFGEVRGDRFLARLDP